MALRSPYLRILGALLLLCVAGAFPQPACARIHYYGGPVLAAPGGRYYPPGNFYGSLWVNGSYPGWPGSYHRDREPLDFNPAFIPGQTVFTPPSYVPTYFPRSYYLAPIQYGDYSHSSVR